MPDFGYFGPQNFEGWVRKSDVDGSKLLQLPITVQYFVAIGRRVRENIVHVK